MGNTVDNSYIEIGRKIVAAIQKKKPAKQSLALADQKRNVKTATDHIIAENWGGRRVERWEILFKQYHWSERTYDNPFTVCSAFTNFHTSFFTLRDDNVDVSTNARKLFHAVGVKALEKKRVVRMQYRESCKKRF